MTTPEHLLVDYEVTEEGILYDAAPEDAAFSEAESDPLASESESDRAEQDAREEVFGASIDDLMEESRRSRRRGRKRRTGIGGGAGKKKLRWEVPANFMFHMGLANVAYMNKDFPAAEEALQVVIRGAPKAAAPYRTLGLILEEKGEWKKALEMCMKAATLDPRDRELWKRNAARWEEMGDPEQAILCLTNALKGTHGTDEDALRARGILYMKTGKWRMAADNFIKLSRLLPTDLGVAKAIVSAYERRGEGGRAIEPLEVMLRTCEQNTPRSKDAAVRERHELVVAELVQTLVELQFQQKRFFEASHLLSRLQMRAATHDRSLTFVQRLMFAVCQHRLGSESLAAPMFMEFMASADTVARHIFLLWQIADACRDSGDYTKGLMAYDLLADQEDERDQETILLHRATCYKELGDRAAARRDLERILELNPKHLVALQRLPEFLDEGEVMPGSKPRTSRRGQGDGGESRRLGTAKTSITKQEARVEVHKTAVAALHLANSYYDAGDYRSYLVQLYPYLAAGLQLDGPTKPYNSHGDGNWGASSDDESTPDAVHNAYEHGERKEFLPNPHLSASEKLKMQKVGMALLRLLDENGLYSVADKLVNAFRQEGGLAGAYIVTNMLEPLSLLRYGERSSERFNLRMLKAVTSIAVGDMTDVYDSVRLMMLEMPLDPLLAYAFSIAERYLSRGPDKCRISSVRFLSRLTKKHPSSVYLVMLFANCGARGGVNTCKHTMGLYLRALKMAPQSPLVCLCAALQMLYVALSRRVDNRNRLVIQAFSLLNEYARLRVKSADEVNRKWLEMEAEYNTARLMHQLGLVDCASHLYKRILDFGVGDEVILPMWADLRRDAAFNLAQIYKASGSGDAALGVMSKYLRF